MKKENVIIASGALLLIIGGWALFSLLRIFTSNILINFGIDNEIYQYLFIIGFVVLFFVITGYGFRGAWKKLLGLK